MIRMLHRVLQVVAVVALVQDQVLVPHRELVLDLVQDLVPDLVQDQVQDLVQDIPTVQDQEVVVVVVVAVVDHGQRVSWMLVHHHNYGPDVQHYFYNQMQENF